MGKTSSGAILRVGVTGGIGSGKTLVCSLFAKYGIPVLIADDVAKGMMQSDNALRSGLSSLLGSSAYGADGSLDRAYVAGRIFSDKLLKQKVNQLVHPKVEAGIDTWFAELERSGEKIGVVEAALIYEAGYDKRLDVVIVIDVPESVRIERVVARDSSSPEEVKKRITAQALARQKAKKADFVIHNEGSVSQLETSVQFLLRILQTITKKQ